MMFCREYQFVLINNSNAGEKQKVVKGFESFYVY